MALDYQNSLFSQLSQKQKGTHTHEGLRSFLPFYFFTFLLLTRIQAMEVNAIMKISKKFALRIVKLYIYLRDEQHENVMSKQLYRSGTSIGANIAESVFAQSDADYISKLSIALKEASETMYWLELLHEAGIINDIQFDSVANDARTIIGTLVNIINKVKERIRLKVKK